MNRQIWGEVITRYNTPLPSFAAVKQLFFMGAAILLAK